MMQHFSLLDIQRWERFYRANFINSISGYKSVSLIGSINESGQNNLAIYSSIIHLGSDPALIGFINRPLAASSHTIANIQATRIYTINHIHPSFIKRAHQTSAKYPENVDEFEAVGLHSVIKEGIMAPFVAESQVQYALELVEIMPIKINNTFLVIGKITNVFVENDIIEPDGFLSLQNIKTCTSLGLDAYFSTELINRFEYARVI